MSTSFIYLDNNATTPLLPEVAEAIHEVMILPYGNPSSHHSVGEGTRGLLRMPGYWSNYDRSYRS